MSIKIGDDRMTCDLSPHTAEQWQVPADEEPPTLWRVSWLPTRYLGRNEAITAMILAEHVAAIDDLGPDHKRWPFIDSWSAELGLSADEAVKRIRESPQREMEIGR